MIQWNRYINKELGVVILLVGVLFCLTLVSHTSALPTPVPNTTYETQYYDPFVGARWNLTNLSTIVPQPYMDKFGYLIWGIFWGALLMAFWVRQEDITLPAFTYLILFVVLSLADWLPASFVVISWVLVAICLGAILYTLFRGRKHG